MRVSWKVIFFTGIISLCALFFLSNSSCDTPWRKEVQEADLYDVDLLKTDDGVYTGQHSYRDYMYIVQAEVADHQIVDIEIVDWDPNDARTAALAIFDRVIENQSLCVDAITGATTASKLYLLCLEDAFPYHKSDECPEWEYE
ncbi:MAG: hypothetical protein JSV25_07785 [Spirochaetota bacterium]|nr:MAG: hypothetical protein JSV25_07785 [Spirochaetota bacterium]